MSTPSSPTFDNSYARMPERFYARQLPEPVATPGPIRVNEDLACHLGIDPEWLKSAEGTEVLAGNRIPDGAEPIAAAYAGHQFGAWNPQLGDGRAILLGEVIAIDGTRYDIQLKGAGRTPYSRGGDGRAPLGPVLREYIVSEAMAALGIPTTRSLAAVTTGEPVVRESMLPGAVLARVAQSHIRIGTFEFFASKGDTEALQMLVSHVVARHYPEQAAAENQALALLREAVHRQAQLMALWQMVGFIHGVMNTDNVLLSGETIDYGPCAFMDGFDPNAVYSSIDRGGRYAYRNQPGIAHWNLSNLAKSLLPLLHDDAEQAATVARDSLEPFVDQFLDANLELMGRKLGFSPHGGDDEALLSDLLSLMAETGVDFTLTFRRFADLADDEASHEGIGEIFQFPPAFDEWLQRWHARLQEESTGPSERQASMYAINPAFIARNHLVEEAIDAATLRGDFDPFHALVDRLARPFDYDPHQSRLALSPRPEQVVLRTFCGT